MKKRLLVMLLLLCLLLTALTATVGAEGATDFSYFNYYDVDAKHQITFKFHADYTCRAYEKYGDPDIVTAMPSNLYMAQSLESWTPNKIEFKIAVNKVYCKGREDGGDRHGEHTNLVTEPTKTVTFEGSDLCHKPLTNLTATIGGVLYRENDALTFTVTTEEPRYTLIKHPKSAPSCTEYGYSQDCYECPGCGKFFADADATQPLEVSEVQCPMADHDNDSNGICKKCGAGSAAYTLSASGRTYYTTVEAALAAAYEDPNNLSVWIMKDVQAITLTDSCNVHVCKGVTIPEISTSASDSQAAININITNHGSITQINIPDNESLCMTITNNEGARIDTIGQRNSTAGWKSVTIRNNGTVSTLYAKKPIKLLSGTGTYVWINTENTDSKVGELLAEGCKFYQTEEKGWYGPECSLRWMRYSIVSTPPFSVTVTGPTGFTSDESGYSLTLEDTAVNNQKLTAELSFPDNKTPGLSSEGARLSYKWYYAGIGTPTWTTAELPLNELAVGVNQLTLRVTDERYNYTYSTNVTVTITSDKRTSISLKVSGGPFTKMYDGKDTVPENLTIGFVDSFGRTVPLKKDTDYKLIEAKYNSANCKDAEKITVKVELIGDAANTYSLPTNTLTVDGAITKFKLEGTSAFFYMKWWGHTANVGDRMMDHLPPRNDAKNIFTYWNSSKYGEIPNPLDANPTITYYRMRTEGTYDHTTDEKITENSIFAHEGEYLIYAVVGETDNYAELFTECATLTVKASGNHTHCLYGHKGCEVDYQLTYDGFNGSSLSPNGSKDQRSYYLNAAKSTVNLTLILRQLSDSSGETPSLDLCLYGKTLRADSNYTEQFRVTNKWHLSLTNCVGTGVLKGTSVDDAHGGCLYVADATVDISNIKVTGGIAKNGGAIVVDKDGTLNLYSGEISGNYVTGGKGGAIYVKSGGTVNIYGGTIRNNHAYSGDGGAIYVAEGGTLNLYGGEISGNTASGLGGGIYVETGGRVNVKGAPIVKDNTANGKPSNLCICVSSSSPLLTIDAEGLTTDAQIGISTDASCPVLLAGGMQTDYSAYFIPDDANTFVLYNSDAKTLTLCAKPTATLEGDTLTITTGSGNMSNTFVLFAAEYDADGKMLAVQSWNVAPQKDTYTCGVKNPGAKIKCFLLRATSYTPVLTPFSPLA